MIPNNVANILNRVCPNINFQGVNSPDDLAQLLLNSGKVSQAQVNQAKQMWSNPQIQQRINSQFFN